MTYDFTTYMAKIDAIVGAKVGLSIHDLPDLPFRDFYDDGVPPARVAARAIREAF